MQQNKQKPHFTGGEAESVLELLSSKTFLCPWVFRSPVCNDGDEFSDVAIYLGKKLILMEVKGNVFDPQNPQRYLKQAQKRHRQLERAEGIVRRKSKTVHFKNDFFSFESNFSDIQEVYLISVSAGRGEMEVASAGDQIDYSKLNSSEVAKYMGFYDPEKQVHIFTLDELKFASKHIDTLKDFCWYLEFERKFFSDDYSEAKSAIGLIDANREDLISVYLLNYYWDEELNLTGKIHLDKILGTTDVLDADKIIYVATDIRHSLEEDELYKKIEQEKQISYFWDDLIQQVFSQYEYAYMLTQKSGEKQRASIDDLKEVLELLSLTSRLERTIYSEKIIEADKKGLIMRNMYSIEEGCDYLVSYAHIEYAGVPSEEEQQQMSYRHLYSAWCRIQYGEKSSHLSKSIKKVLLVTKHTHKDKAAFSFALSTEIKVEREVCKKLGLI